MAGPGDLLAAEPRVVNVGLESLAEPLAALGVAVVQVAWAPPAGGDPERAARLAELEDEA
jgi:hypothetical protein